jgi:hypothetical protein
VTNIHSGDEMSNMGRIEGATEQSNAQRGIRPIGHDSPLYGDFGQLRCKMGHPDLLQT